MQKKPNNIESRILEYLRNNAPNAHYPKILANEINVKPSTVRQYCKRLFDRGLIQRDLRGLYRSIFTLDDILKTECPEMALHGIKLEGTVTKLEQGLHSCNFQPGGSGGRLMSKRVFEGRGVTMLLSPEGTLEIFMQTTKYPINYDLWLKFMGWLDGVFDGMTPLLDLHIVQLGIGRDFKLWRFEGCKAIKITDFGKAWSAQVYQKGNKMRVEVHILKDRITISDAQRMLKGMVAEVEIKQDQPPKPGMYG